MPNMKGMGPACCCCKDIWPTYARSQMKTAKPATFDWIAPGVNGGNGDFDHVNRRALYINDGSGNSADFYLHDEKGGAPDSFVINRTFSVVEYTPTVIGVVDPDGERIVTHSTQAIDPTHDEIVFHKVNYDGTGDTALFTLPIFESPDYNSVITHMHYNRTTGTVFAWLFRSSSSASTFPAGFSAVQTYFEIIEFDLAGGAHSVIHNFPTKRFSTSEYIGQVYVLEIDYTNNKLWWEILEVTSDLAATFTRKIQRSDFDGSNLETILSETGPFAYSHIGWQYSHKDDKFYLSTNNASLSQAADTANGFWRVEPDWSDKELLFNRPDMIATPSYFRLGCGYETLGASSPA